MLTLCLLLGGIHKAEVLAPRRRFFAKQNTDNAPCAAFLSNIFGGAKILAGCRAEVLAPRISFCEANAVFLAKQNTDGVLQKKRECVCFISLAFLRFHFSLWTSVEGACDRGRRITQSDRRGIKSTHNTENQKKGIRIYACE